MLAAEVRNSWLWMCGFQLFSRLCWVFSVSARKCRKLRNKLVSCSASTLSAEVFAAFMRVWSDSDRRLDRRIRVVTFQREVFELEAEDVAHCGVDFHGRQRARLARQLQCGLFHVVGRQVRIAEGVHEIAR